MVEDTDAKILTAEERDLISYFGGNCATATEMNAVGGLKVGKYVVRQDTNSFWQYNGTAWVNTLVNPSASVGAVTTILDDNLTPSKVVLSNTLGKIAVGDVTSSELLVLRTSNTATGSTIIDTNRLVINDGSNIRQNSFSKVWDWIVSKAIGAVSTILTNNLTINRALVSDGAGKVSVSPVTTTQLANLFTLGTSFSSTAVDTLTASVAETVINLTLSEGTWLVFGGFAMNQATIENTSDFVAGIITDAPTTFTTQVSLVSNPNASMFRMAEGADAGGSFTPRIYTVATGASKIVSLRLLSDFTTETDTVESTMTAIKIGI